MSLAAEKPTGPLSYTMNSLAGKPVELSKYQGKVVLVVNVASECGLTPQYAGLQQLHEQYAGKGLAVLGFPANEFGAQEPGTNAQIATFCKQNYGVTFDMFAKIDVNGENACPLYKHLTSLETQPKGAGKIGWNFEKFLLDRQGHVIGRFDPQTSPRDPEIVKAVEGALARQ